MAPADYFSLTKLKNGLGDFTLEKKNFDNAKLCKKELGNRKITTKNAHSCLW
jgi:hypothetical protein